MLCFVVFGHQGPFDNDTCQKSANITVFQDKFDHDKGQKSAISGRRLHWRLSTGFFAFSPVFMCNLVRRAPQNLEKGAKNPVEKIASNPVTSVAVMVFSVLSFGPHCSSNFPPDFPELFLGNPRAHPENSHSLLEFSELRAPAAPGTTKPGQSAQTGNNRWRRGLSMNRV